MVVFRLAPVTDKVETTDHFTNGEETDDLGGGDTGEGELLRAGVADAGQEVLGGGQALDSGGVLGGVDQGLEVGLEGGGRAVGIGMVRSWERMDGNSMAEAEAEGRGLLRRSHVLATEHQLAELNADLGVVESRGDHS